MNKLRLRMKVWALVILKRISICDIVIKHHWAPGWVRLHPYKHKGYWYHGRRREQANMLRCAAVVRSGDIVLEVGGHIGYLTRYFSMLVSNTGRVVVFEPAKENCSYLLRNVKRCQNVRVVPSAVSNDEVDKILYVEDFTGQNNSLVQNCAVYEKNSEVASLVGTHTSEERVKCVTLDLFCQREGICPNFVKIDVEGGELGVLQGMCSVLMEARPIVMFEVSESAAAVGEIFKKARYRIEHPNGEAIVDILKLTPGNYFGIPV